MVDDARALELRRAGVPVARIQQELGLGSPAEVEAAVLRALEAQGIIVDPVRVRDLELDRLDRIHQSVWVKAVKGDLAAVDRVMKLAEIRVRLAGIEQVGVSRMVEAFERTVDALGEIGPEDAALVAAGRRIAEKIDAAGAGIDATAETKALYLVPHLMNVLRELGATPAARAAIKKAAPALPDPDDEAEDSGGDEGVPVDLDTFKARRFGGSPG